MAKVLGLGGIFFQVPNPEDTRKWYADILGFNCDDYGTSFLNQEPGTTAHEVWCPFKEGDDYFKGSTFKLAINLRVDNLDELVTELKAKNIAIKSEVKEYEYGKFAQIFDLNNMIVELWEVYPKAYSTMVQGAATP